MPLRLGSNKEILDVQQEVGGDETNIGLIKRPKNQLHRALNAASDCCKDEGRQPKIFRTQKERKA